MSRGYRSEQGLSPTQTIGRGCKSDAIILVCIMLINRRVIVVAIFKVVALIILDIVVTISQSRPSAAAVVTGADISVNPAHYRWHVHVDVRRVFFSCAFFTAMH